jgi:hypothetical protein
MKTWLGLVILLFVPSTLMARPTRPELDLTLQDEISAYKYQFKEKIRRARLLLRSDKMDRAYSVVLGEVLKERIREDGNFDTVLKALGRSREKVRVEPESTEDHLFRYSRALKEQADLFYILVKTAHHDQPMQFNKICEKMLSHLSRMDLMEKDLRKFGYLLKPMGIPVLKSKAEIPVSETALWNTPGS